MQNATTETGTTYTRNQARLAATPAGILAAGMTCGSRWLTPGGVVVMVWKAWTPDVEGYAEETARKYKWPLDSEGHNTEIGIESRERGTQRINVAKVGGWRPAA